MLAREETLDCFVDNHVRAGIIGDFPAIAHFLSRNQVTIYNNYTTPIDLERTQELESNINNLPGFINISFDGAMVNDRQKVSQYSSLSIIIFVSYINHFTFCRLSTIFPRKSSSSLLTGPILRAPSIKSRLKLMIL